jgi:hypothetical protein
MIIPDFEMWQRSECCRLGITTEEHNEILKALNKMSSVGWPSSYDAFINAIGLHSTVLKSLDMEDNKSEHKYKP